jgi:linoleoyl-CoA desaturase
MQKPVYPGHGQHKLFIAELRSEVNNYFKSKKIGKTGGVKLMLRSALLLSLYMLFLSGILLFSEHPIIYYTCCVMMGVISLPIILNIGHDAVHNTFSSYKWVNKIAGFVFCLLGTSPYFWRLRHIYSHHAFANVLGWDKDIEQAGVMKIHDGQTHRFFYKVQHIYMPVVFCFYTINWFFYRDVKDMFTKQFGNKIVERHPAKEIGILLLSKIIFFSIFIVMPVAVQDASLKQAIAGFFLFHISASLVTTLALVSTHLGTEQKFVMASNKHLPYPWEIHQMETTSDFATQNRFITWFFGGFNHHVVHHIFPDISHVHYPAITPIVKAHAGKYNVQYNSSKTLQISIGKFFALLKQHAIEHQNPEL